MSNYYNRKKGPLSVTLLNKKSMIFPSKRWSFVEDSQDSSPMILRYLKLGYLYKEVVSPESQVVVPNDIKVEVPVVKIQPPLEMASEPIQEVTQSVVTPDEVKTDAVEEVKETPKRRKTKNSEGKEQ